MSELPENWVKTTLGEICTHPQYGWTSKSSKKGKIRLLRTTDISGGPIFWENVPYCDKEPDDLSKYLLQRDDILVSRAGSVGISAHIGDVPYKSVFASYLIRFNPLINPTFVSSYLLCRDYWQFISESSSGIAVPNVNASKLALLDIPLPPLNEQHRIVAKLDQLLPKVRLCEERLEKTATILKRFRQSVLAAACSGKLTADWRKIHPENDAYISEDEHDFPVSWQINRIGTLTKLVTSGSRGWAKFYSDSGSIFIRAQNINSDILNLDDIAYVKLPHRAEGLRTKVQKHDILVTITGANVTKSALVEVALDDAYVSQHVALIRLKDVSFAKFLFYSIVSLAHGRKQLQDVAYGQGKPGLNLDNIRDVIVGIPSQNEQKEIVRRVESLFKIADQIEARYQQAKTNIDKITQSILAKAFRGELVTQNPNDEPASVLLERIKAEKNVQTAKPSKKKKQSSFKTRTSEQGVANG